MSESLAAPPAAVERLDPRRRLQLALATAWLLDGILQLQPSMFTTAFPRMLSDGAHGNPALVAAPIAWTATFVGHHLAVTNAVFAAVQVALGLGIAWRPTVKPVLAASVAWSLGVWWLGEGLGGVLAGTASPLDGAPGAVILYGVLAVLLWPADRIASAPFTAARAVGRGVARGLWLAVWGSMAVFALGHQAALAAVLAIVAAGALLPARRTRPAVILALVVAVALGLAQGLGGIFTGSATDPNSGPLLALLALAFWPAPAKAGA